MEQRRAAQAACRAVALTAHLWNKRDHRAIKEALSLIRWRHKLFRWVDKKEPTNVISSRLKSV